MQALVLKGIENEAFIWWQNSGMESRGELGDCWGRGVGCASGSLAPKLPSQSRPLVCCLDLHTLGKECFLLIVNPGEFAAVIWGWGGLILCLWFGGTSGFWFADLLMCLVGIKGAERGGLPHSTSRGSAQISPHLLGGSLSFSLNFCPPGNPFDSVAEEWRKRYVLFPWAVLTGGPIFLQKTLCFNPRMSPLCGEISLKLPKANRMENKRQLTLIVLFIYIT